MRVSIGPQGKDDFCEFLRRIAPAEWSIGASKIGIAKVAYRIGAILFSSRPEIASGKPNEYGGSAGMIAFALEGVIYFFYFVHES